MEQLFDQVNDINAAVADVKSKNIRCLSAEPRIGQNSCLHIFIGSLIIFGIHQECTPELLLLQERMESL